MNVDSLKDISAGDRITAVARKPDTQAANQLKQNNGGVDDL